MTNLTARHRLALAGTAALVFFASPAAAQECSNADFKGRYAVQSSSSIIGGTQGNTAAGTLCADGAGMITEWKDTFVFSLINPEGGEDKLIRERDHVGTALGPVTYDVGSDCRITIRFTSGVRPPHGSRNRIKGRTGAGRHGSACYGRSTAGGKGRSDHEVNQPIGRTLGRGSVPSPKLLERV